MIGWWTWQNWEDTLRENIKNEIDSWSFDYNEHVPVAIKVVEQDYDLGVLRNRLVPTKIKEEEFWCHYFFAAKRIVSQLTGLQEKNKNQKDESEIGQPSPLDIQVFVGNKESQAGEADRVESQQKPGTTKTKENGKVKKYAEKPEEKEEEMHVEIDVDIEMEENS